MNQYKLLLPLQQLESIIIKKRSITDKIPKSIKLINDDCELEMICVFAKGKTLLLAGNYEEPLRLLVTGKTYLQIESEDKIKYVSYIDENNLTHRIEFDEVSKI